MHHHLSKRFLSSIIVGIIVLGSILLATPPTSQAQDGGQQQYTVQAGDNLYRISLRFGTTVQAIAAANQITNPNLIFVGQVLTIPSGTTPVEPSPEPSPEPPSDDTQPPPSTGGSYTVVGGDTLYRIALRFNTTVSQIVALNSNITNPNLIFAGQVINLPGGSGGTTQPPADSGSDGSDGGTTPPPVVTPGTSGGFELGGQVNGFGNVDVMRSAAMSWAKVQITWNRGDGTGPAANAINQARANGLNILLSIAGNKDQMGDFEAYTNEFAAYLGEVAALGPNAIEVWNEPNIDREWPVGQINGGNYTQMLSKAYNAIKSRNGNVMVISAAPAPTGFFGAAGCTVNGCNDDVFIAQMRNAGAAQFMDCVGTHYNEGIISPDLRSGDPRGSHYSHYFWGMLDLYYNTFGGQRQVCWTELGYLSPEGYGELTAHFGWASDTSVAEHAEWLGRAAALSRGSGRVRLMIVWNVNYTGFGDDPQGGYAIIRPGGGCPACGTLASAMQ